MSLRKLDELKVAAELARRKRDGLSMFRAIGPDMKPSFPDQVGLFGSQASEILVRGGNRCVSGSQLIYDPVARRHRRVDQIRGQFHVWGFDPHSGQRVIGVAGQPFAKGVGQIHEVQLSNGQSFLATLGHCVLTERGWLPLGVVASSIQQESAPVQLLSTAGTDLPVFPRDVPHYWQTVADSLADCRLSVRSCGAPPQQSRALGPAAAPSPGGAPTRSRDHGRADGLDSTPSRIRSCTAVVRRSSWDVGLRMAGQCDASGSHASWRLYSPPSASGPAGQRSAAESDRPVRTTVASAQLASRCDGQPAARHGHVDSTTPAWMNTPVDDQSQWPLGSLGCAAAQLHQHQSWDCPSALPAPVYVISVSYVEEAMYYDFSVEAIENYELAGVLHHNSSKSMCSAALFASVARDRPITTWDGKLIDTRRPWQKGRPLTMWIVGLQLNHIGQTIYRLLFKAGAYKIIKDDVTGEWRAFRPWDPADQARSDTVKPSWPLIPASEIDQKGWAWYNKTSRQFEVCRLKNGTEIWSFASTSDVKQGDPVDYIWIDEAIQNPDHYAEWQLRIPDLKGRIVWSSWPRKGNPALVRLTERAAEQEEEFQRGLRQKVNVKEFLFTFSGNPFIDDEEKQKVREGLTEEELRARDAGEYDLDNMKIYPWFDASIHRALGRTPEEDDRLGRVLRDNAGIPPNDWTHELIIDPGSAKPAVLFCAVPPPHLWDDNEPYFVPYKEIYKVRMTADDLALEISQFAEKYHITFRRFIIDGQAAKQTPMGYAGTVGDNYSRAFERYRLFSYQTGQFFQPGDPNFIARTQVVERWLRHRPNSRPQLRIVVENCKQLVWQMLHNQKHMAENRVEEKEARNQFNDVRVALEYWASRNPGYELQREIKRKVDTPYDVYQRWVQERFGSRQPSGGLNFGPGAVSSEEAA